MDSFNPFTLRGKRILVTGASSGLGYASAVAIARMGGEVIGVGRDEDRLAAVQRELATASDAPHRVIRADLTVEDQRANVIASLGGAIDGVLHCAGISRLCPVRMMSVEHLRQIQTINVEAPVLLTQGLLRKSLVKPGGSLVFVSSIAAHIGVPGVGAYSGSKAALLGFARCLAMEVVKHKTRVNCLSPALVETPLLRDPEAVVLDTIEKERKNYPLGFGQPDDVANAAIFLLSDASRWITGTTLVMDGGLTIS